ncbi:predicted protein [Naegleria gruberi]|uniref:Predicted protein n=1 Tax=Naegleria gruberi TaxID=5762 RepID=D2VXC8_NAEGR|nr:uncharacterized protein NAEGRDRAFT_59495 [Naegleria gruberi]EFC38483.1 predicted protein [Naegleria gruberi]|eukprot:XP_002671227.1 predicted protein [Naegleria gruberi strain NEG-M]
MEAETTLNIEQLELKNEKLFGKSKLKIENKRIEHVKLIKSNDMILSKNLLQKHVNSEKLKEISDRLITCELELEVKLQYYKNYKDEYSKQSEKLEQIYQKESESLIEYEEQVQKIIQIDDTICKMLNHDIDAFRELFMDDPRNLLDQQLDHHLDFNSPSLLNSVTTVGSIGNNLSNTAQLYDITGNIGPLTSQSINNSNNNNSSNSSGSSSNSSQQNTRNTISLSNENVEPEYSRKQTILPTRRMFNSAAALNLGILDGSSNRDSSLPLKQLKDTCNPYIQQAYKELRRKTFTSATTTSTNTSNNNNNTTNAAILESNDNDEEVEVFNTLYRIRPNRKWYMMEPIKKLPNKYSIDRLLHGENTPQDIIPKIYPYPDEYNDPDLYYDKISHRDGFYNEEEEEMFQNQYNDDDDEFKSFNRNYSNYFDLPSNVDELRTMIIKLQFEKEDMRNEISKLKQQLSSNNSNSTPSTPFSTTPTNNSIMNDSFNSLQPLTTSTSSNNNNITSPNTLSMPQSSSKQPIEYVASDFIDDYIE